MAADRPSVKSVVDGLKYAKSRPELLGTYLVDINAMFFGMPAALYPFLAADLGGPKVRTAEVVTPPERERVVAGDEILLCRAGALRDPAHAFQTGCTLPVGRSSVRRSSVRCRPAASGWPW